MKSDIDIIKETKFDFIEVMIGRGVQYDTCGKISAAINGVVDSLAAPVASAAPSGVLPPLPDPECNKGYSLGSDEEFYSAEQMHEYAHAAIASSSPKAALTDAKIRDIWRGLGGQDRWLKDFGFIQFARAIEAALASLPAQEQTK